MQTSILIFFQVQIDREIPTATLDECPTLVNLRQTSSSPWPLEAEDPHHLTSRNVDYRAQETSEPAEFWESPVAAEGDRILKCKSDGN